MLDLAKVLFPNDDWTFRHTDLEQRQDILDDILVKSNFEMANQRSQPLPTYIFDKKFRFSGLMMESFEGLRCVQGFGLSNHVGQHIRCLETNSLNQELSFLSPKNAYFDGV